MNAVLNSQAQSSHAAVTATLALAEREVISAQALKLPAVDYFDAFTRTIDGLFESNAQAMKVLVGELQTRLYVQYRAGILLALLMVSGLAATSADLGVCAQRHWPDQQGAGRDPRSG